MTTSERKGVLPQIMERPVSFALSFTLFFFVTFVFLAAMDTLPEPATAHADSTQEAVKAEVVAVSKSDLPVRIAAPKIGLDASVANPVSTNITALDQSLLKGAARYPTSAKLGEVGTVLIFGHSSYLPVVHNQAYKTFDGIQDLKTGDIVSVYSATEEYRYKVVGVRVADATEDVVELATSGKHLVLVTCNSFAAKTSRFVVSAVFVGTYSLASN